MAHVPQFRKWSSTRYFAICFGVDRAEADYLAGRPARLRTVVAGMVRLTRLANQGGMIFFGC